MDTNCDMLRAFARFVHMPIASEVRANA